MDPKGIYENLYFDNTVNVIDTGTFPHDYPLHWHQYVEIAALPEDADVRRLPVLRVNQTEYRMNPGDILLIWPGELHETVENTDGQLIGLQFFPAVFHELPEFTPYLHIFRTYHHIRGLSEPELAQRMAAHIQRLLAVQKSRRIFFGVESLICLYEMFMDFGTYIQNTVLPGAGLRSSGADRTIGKISMACTYIADNCEHEITLESTAGYVGFSACYFSRIFKKITNYNFIEYLTLQRIKRAQLLLADSDIPITELSYRAGFRSISTFNRVFRQYRGCSPSEYRKYYLK